MSLDEPKRQLFVGWAREAAERRPWATLPYGFELDAVRALVLRLRPHLRADITRRIALGHATTFEEVLTILGERKEVT